MAVLVSDSFNRTNSTTTLGTTDSYNGGNAAAWAVTVGTWGVNTNQAYNPSATDDSFAVVDSGVANVKVSSALTYSTAEIGLYFRVTDANNRFRVVFSGGRFYLQRKTTGAQTTLANWAVTQVNGDILRVECDADVISVYLNGTILGSVTDSFNNTATKHGIGIGVSASAARWDNFQVETIGASGTSGSTSYATKQTIYQTSSVAVATKQTITQAGSAPYATRQVINQTSSAVYSTKQQIYQIDSISYATQQTIADGGIVGSASYATKQTVYAIGNVPFATKQTINKINSILLATRQILIEATEQIGKILLYANQDTSVHLRASQDTAVYLYASMSNSVALEGEL